MSSVVDTDILPVIEPIVDEATTTILEALVTQVVFFFVILLLILVVCAVVYCHVIGLSAWDTLAIVVILVVVAVVLLVGVSYYILSEGKSATSNLKTYIKSNVTLPVLLETIDTAALQYNNIANPPP